MPKESSMQAHRVESHRTHHPKALINPVEKTFIKQSNFTP